MGRDTTITFRVTMQTAVAIATAARRMETTQKQVVCWALANAGVAVDPLDLTDATPKRGVRAPKRG